jgi:hypothetical protein
MNYRPLRTIHLELVVLRNMESVKGQVGRRASLQWIFYRVGSIACWIVLQPSTTAEGLTMKIPVLLLSACLAQTSGQSLNITTLSLITAFTEQAKATSSVLFFCWSPAGKTYRTFLFWWSWAMAAVRGFIAQSCCAQGEHKLPPAVVYWCIGAAANWL